MEKNLIEIAVLLNKEIVKWCGLKGHHRKTKEGDVLLCSYSPEGTIMVGQVRISSHLLEDGTQVFRLSDNDGMWRFSESFEMLESFFKVVKT